MATTTTGGGGKTLTSVPAEFRLKLDESSEALSLLSILRAFDGPVNEERAWAVLYQSAKTALQCFSNSRSANHNSSSSSSSHHHHHLHHHHSNNNNNNDTIQSDNYSSSTCLVVGETSQLWIHRDGHVHPKSFYTTDNNTTVNEDDAEGRTVAECQSQLISGLGWALFEALDYGCKREEQNILSPDLEQMIDLMTSAGVAEGGESQSAAEDEGIERDSPGEPDDHAANSLTGTATVNAASAAAASAAATGNSVMTSLSNVMDRCRMQISSTASSVQADAHFRAVCRALVAETLEFSDFLVKVSSAPENWRELRSKPELQCTELTELHLADWAKLWVQVIRQLRNGVKLKAIGVGESARKPIEYELTPYEMMMDDIRSRRYKLRQVMVDGAIPPRVKKDAHAVILEFIRSRPPLRKASERKLGPPARRVSTPVELLMESIRRHDSKELRPTRSLMVQRTEASTSSLLAVPGSASTTQRKLLKADHINPLLLNFSQDDEEDDLEEIPPGSPPRLPGAFVPDQFTSCSSSSDLSTPLNPNTHNFRLRNNKTIQREISPRRHSITALPNALSRTLSAPFPKSRSHNSHLSTFAQPSDPRIRLHPSQLSGEPGSLPCSGPSSSASSVSSASLPSPPGSPMMHNHLQDDFVRSEQFQQEVQGKLITLEELVRMRRVLTAASLENLPLDSSVKDDVACGKVCFVCRKTRFSVFNTKTWWHNCKLCRRTVCIKCCSKMRIPSDRFENVAVTELSHAVSSSSSIADKKKSDEPEEPPPKTPLSATSSSSLLSHLAHLKLPQFRISTPGGGTESSTPSSPVTGRRKQNVAAQQSYSASGHHQPLSRHLSLSANATPVRNRLSAQASIACPNTQQQSRKAPTCESHVCRDCQTLIERIVYHPVHTLHPVDHAHHHQQQQQQPVHVSLP